VPERAFVPPVPGPPTSVFGTRRFFNDRPRSPHPGLDLRAAGGTPVVAAGPGSVALAADLYYSGNTVILDHGGGLFTLYAHLERIDVAEGDRLRAGDKLGLSGATGRVTGPHLHWGAKVGDRPFDPRALLDSSLFDPLRVSAPRTPPAPPEASPAVSSDR
jgi:murein DD-endopeptidase MepM/ murein hydrolase activator NlpD